MLKYLFCLFLCSSFVMSAQDSLYVKLSPQSEVIQLMLYGVEGTQQQYISNSKSKENDFKFEFPTESEPGVYRLFFDIQNNGFIEILYNKESISVSFDPLEIDTSASFSMSKENKIYEAYIQSTLRQQTTIDSLQMVYFSSEESDLIKIKYSAAVEELKQSQHSFEEMSKGLMAHEFIISRRNYNAEEIWNEPDLYMTSTKSHFFDAIDFGNPILRNSSIFIDKVVEYVFYLNDSNDTDTYLELKQRAVDDVMLKVGNHHEVKSELLSSLLYALGGQQEIEMINFIISQYYEKLPIEYQNERFLTEIDRLITTAIGNEAPEISWIVNGEANKLSEMKGSNEVFIIAFWSTSCSHCLNDIPKLYDFTKDYEGLQIIAVALEEEREDFDTMTKEMPQWIHVYGANKWENEIARAYDVNGTPSYFVLDKNLKIIAKPEELEDLQSLFDQD